MGVTSVVECQPQGVPFYRVEFGNQAAADQVVRVLAERYGISIGFIGIGIWTLLTAK